MLSTVEQLSPAKLAEIAVFRSAGQKITELSALVNLVRQKPLRTIVEIGTDKGGTFWLWCKVAEPDATIISIDLPGGDYGVGYSEDDARRFRTWAKPEQKLHFLLKDSHDEETKNEVMRLLGGEEVDL